MKLLEHGMKVVERLLEKMLHGIATVDEMQVGFMSESGTIDAVFILRNMQEEYHAKGKKFYSSFVNLEKAFARVLWKVLELAMRTKGIPDVFVRSMMSLFEGAKIMVRVDSDLSKEFEVKVGMHHRSMQSHLCFAVVVDVVT